MPGPQHDHHDHDHDHDHDHHHGHHHHHGPADYNIAFAVGTLLNLGFVAVEAGYGVWAHSLALLADAGHNFSDVIGLVMAWAAVWLSGRRSSRRHTYGYGRTTIMASLINGTLLLLGIGAVAWEAVLRLAHPEPVSAPVVMGVAGVGIVINVGTALMFLSGRKGDLNIRGTFLHMASDALVAAGVVVAAFLMGKTGWLWIDPLVSLGIAVVILLGTWGLFRESLDLALDAVPEAVDRDGVEAYLRALPGVTALHDLHIWPLSTRSVALTAHLVVPGAVVDDAAMERIAADLAERFGIDHATLQLETGEDGIACRLSEVHAC